MKRTSFFIGFYILAGFIISCFSIIKYGNYTDARIGDEENQTLDQLLFFPDREWLFDFDTENPTDGVSTSSSVVISNEYYMTDTKSLKWSTTQGESITFEANIPLPTVWRIKDILSLGIFQVDCPTKENMRVFKLECFSASNAVLHTRMMYLHKGGWNILSSDITGSSSQSIKEIKVTQISGSPGEVYLDNVMIYASQNTSSGVASRGIQEEALSIDNVDVYPTKELSQDERDAFLTIAERVISLPEKVASISESTMTKYRNLHAYYNINVNGEYANGSNPLYYYRSFDKLDQESVSTLQYSKNSDLCSQLKNLGKAWYQTNDAAQKEELGQLFTDLIRLTVTYGGMPNPWYNGRGYAEGVYYAKDLLESEGLLDKATEQLILQYHVDDILYRDHRWELLLEEGEEGEGGASFWQTSCDDLNTAGKSTILTVLVGADTPEKARNLYRFKSWLENLALDYAPSTTGSLKPDGSWFHHWGNRFDNYGWTGAWRGATEYVWWMSHTPFQLDSLTYARMHHMADIHFEVMNKDGYVGPQDAMQKVPAEGFMNLAMAGSANGKYDIDTVMGSYWMAYPADKSHQYNSENVTKVKASGINPAEKEDGNVTLSYDVSNVHRTGTWQVYTRGVTKHHYHTQYERDGFLFYNIGGISLCKEGTATGMQAAYGTSIMLRHENDAGNITPGYNFSRALGVTSVQNDYSSLRQIYYQKGSSVFVGGVSTNNGKGMFAQEFDASKQSSYSSRVAKHLKFKKSYFYFGDDIIALGSDIDNAGDLTGVETGLLQEPTDGGINTFTLSNSITTSGSEYNSFYNSDDVPWFVNNTLGTGIYLFPSQEFALFKGEQTVGTSRGNIISTYLKHNTNQDGYGFILRLNTDETEMRSLGELMNGSTPAYRILQRDSKAHVLFSTRDHTTAYAIFDIDGWTAPSGPVSGVNKPCIVMAQERRSEAQIILTVSDSDKHFDKTEENPMGWSMPSDVSITLSGQFKLPENAADNIKLTFDATSNETVITFAVKDGLPTEITVQEDREHNSIPWIEDFILDDETIEDTGFSSWTMEAFEPQEIGYAYVKNNDFWISGINCNWRSGSIDISGIQDLTLKMNASCDQPKRLSSNDSLCIFIVVDDNPRQLIKKWIDDFEAESFEFSGINGGSLQVIVEGRSDKNQASYIIENIEVSESRFELTSIEFEDDVIELLVGEDVVPNLIFQPENAAAEDVRWHNLTPWILKEEGNRQYKPLKQGISRVYASAKDQSIADTLTIISKYPELTDPWKQISLGISYLGTAIISEDQIVIKGNGISQSVTDNMHFAYERVTGDFMIQGKFSELSAGATSGFMVRADSTSRGKQVSVQTSSVGTRFCYRALDEEDLQIINGDLSSEVIHLKLSRSGSRLKAYESADGVSWDLIRSSSLPLGEDVLLGIFVNGVVYPESSEAKISQLTIEAKYSTINNKLSPQLSIYPNPTTDLLSVRNHSDVLIKTIDLYDLSGKKLLSENFIVKPYGTKTLNLEELGLLRGLYVLRLSTAEKSIVHKISLQ